MKRQQLQACPEEWILADDGDPLDWDWRHLPALSPMQRSDGSGIAKHRTEIRLGAGKQALYVRFDCADRDIWGTLTQRDDPIYQEEAVEIFLGPGAETPREYFEFEVSPKGVLFDARVSNPDSRRETMKVDVAWDCPGIRWSARIEGSEERWSACLVVPWRSLLDTGSDTAIPDVWRANFFRIERPRDGEDEFSCWIPTLAVPPDFHKPEFFGELRLP